MAIVEILQFVGGPFVRPGPVATIANPRRRYERLGPAAEGGADNSGDSPRGAQIGGDRFEFEQRQGLMEGPAFG